MAKGQEIHVESRRNLTFSMVRSSSLSVSSCFRFKLLDLPLSCQSFKNHNGRAVRKKKLETHVTSWFETSAGPEEAREKTGARYPDSCKLSRPGPLSQQCSLHPKMIKSS